MKTALIIIGSVVVLAVVASWATVSSLRPEMSYNPIDSEGNRKWVEFPDPFVNVREVDDDEKVRKAKDSNGVWALTATIPATQAVDKVKVTMSHRQFWAFLVGGTEYTVKADWSDAVIGGYKCKVWTKEPGDFIQVEENPNKSFVTDRTMAAAYHRNPDGSVSLVIIYAPTKVRLKVVEEVRNAALLAMIQSPNPGVMEVNSGATIPKPRVVPEKKD